MLEGNSAGLSRQKAAVRASDWVKIGWGDPGFWVLVVPLVPACLQSPHTPYISEYEAFFGEYKSISAFL